jgi:Uma2 family endonuclease
MSSALEKLDAGGISEKKAPLLESGYHLSSEEFHARYKQMAEDTRAELIEGIVYMASPIYMPHSGQHLFLATLCGAYEFETPGVIGGIAGTVRLDGSNEFQPDLHLRIAPEYGGRTSSPDKKMVLGGPEFVVELSNTTLGMDLHEKFEVYQRDGVLEYLVWELKEKRIQLFGLNDGAFEKIKSNEGVLKSNAMPGLWLNVPAIIDGDKQAAMQTLREGLKSSDHVKFLKRLRGGAK